MKRLLIDGDILVYRAGFAIGDEPVSHALQAVKMMMNNMVFSNAARAGDLDNYQIVVYISDTTHTNFRYGKATTKPYKGNRVAPRPMHYHDIREYLIDRYDAVIVEDMEPDDMLSIENMKDLENSTIASIDKDLDQVPGYHYHIVDKQGYYISKRRAYQNFCERLLTGDPCDNIPGVVGIGAVKARRILDEAKGNKQDMLQIVYDLMTTIHNEDYFMEMGHLVWLWREEERGWDPDLKHLRENRQHVHMVGKAGLKNKPLLRSPLLTRWSATKKPR